MSRERDYRRHQTAIRKNRAIECLHWQQGHFEIDGDEIVFRRKWGDVRLSLHKALAWPRSGEIEPDYRLRPYKRHGRRKGFAVEYSATAPPDFDEDAYERFLLDVLTGDWAE